ncbi:MAG: hypothetical protein Q4F97_07180 [Bacteroidales bacterium]|nr:hypothetical protein [Bacteroidales bacterium]
MSGIKTYTVFIAILFSLISSYNCNIKAQSFPSEITLPSYKSGHIQGIAYDDKNNCMYVSYTTMLVKVDMNGRVLGSVTGLLGHLGCLTFNKEEGRVYGSLEYKDDEIGKGILKSKNASALNGSAFYIAIFDVDKITEEDMSAEKDGIMTTVNLPTVLDDYNADVSFGGNSVKHRFGCSGIDGVSFGPHLNQADDKMYLTVAYGVYGDVNRTDNDYQVLLQYDTKKWKKYERPLSQGNMHRNGPRNPDLTCFVKTGNTSYGVQNLTFDKNSNLWFMACYAGKKTGYPNYTLFAVDENKPVVKKPLDGVSYMETGFVKPFLRGWHYPYGTTGICPLGNGLFYFTLHNKTEKGDGGVLKLFKWNGLNDIPFERVE